MFRGGISLEAAESVCAASIDLGVEVLDSDLEEKIIGNGEATALVYLGRSRTPSEATLR